MKYNIEATVFVYRHLETGKVRALYMDDAHAMTGRDDYEHIATLEPRAWIEAHYDDAEMEREQCAQVCELIDTSAFGTERPAPNGLTAE